MTGFPENSLFSCLECAFCCMWKKNRDQLKSASESAETIPLLQSKLARSHSLTQEKEEQCQSLQAQLSKAELTVQEVKAKILTLHDKLVEEQEAASHHSLVADELRRTCTEQEVMIAKLKASEQAALDQLEITKKELSRAENEKQAVAEELERLEKKRIENEATLREQKSRNQSLREMFDCEKKKWEKLMFEKEYDTEQFADNFLDEVSEKDEEGGVEEDSFSGLGLGYKMLLPGVMITLVAVFYYTLFSYQSVDPRPM